MSVGQNAPPKTLSPPLTKKHPPRSPSPSYFGFVVGDNSVPPDSNPGQHARQNWNIPSSHAASTTTNPRQMSVEGNAEYEAFRRQSEQHHKFNLGNLSRPSASRNNSAATNSNGRASTPISPHTQQAYFDGSEPQASKPDPKRQAQESFFDLPRADSPHALSPVRGMVDHQHARLSLPGNSLQTPPIDKSRHPQRSETLPPTGEKNGPTMITPRQFAELMDRQPEEIILLDLRVYPQYSVSRIRGALNLCIPTTLLKRPTFTVQKLAETFANAEDQARFAKWTKATYIVTYDSNSNLPKEAVVPFNVLKKFSAEGWQGQGLVIKGGFLAVSRTVSDLVDNAPVVSRDSRQTLSISPPAQDAVPVAGGCAMPSSKSAANPFFGNIRQNMDLLDGVGQMSIKCPSDMSARIQDALPSWLRMATKASDRGKMVSDEFLKIEKSEQQRMQEALSGHVSYGSPRPENSQSIQIAGIEQGSKNRYNNIFPYDHSRVRLHEVSNGGSDYVNANFVKAAYSHRNYIATQAPIPTTFADFWRVIWEQQVRVIVMLTAEKEGGQVKSHPYWRPGEYGPFKLKVLSEKRVSLDSTDVGSRPDALCRPSLGQRRSTNPNTPTEKKVAADNAPASTESPAVIVRHLTLSHSQHPFVPMREVTQLQYTQWPDFGAPAEPFALLDLIRQMNKYLRSTSSPTQAKSPSEAAPEGQRPILVHCSAGCGRTGTFCTIDSVIDMLKRQRHERGRSRSEESPEAMDIDAKDEDDWIYHDDIDLVARTVDDFRHQRLSMVQNLRQFVLCYESVLQWVVGEMPQGMKEKKGLGVGGGDVRWSYQG